MDQQTNRERHTPTDPSTSRKTTSSLEEITFTHRRRIVPASATRGSIAADSSHAHR